MGKSKASIRMDEQAVEREEHLANVLRLRKGAVIGLLAWFFFGLVDWFIVTFVQDGRLWLYWTLRGIGLLSIGLGTARVFIKPIPSPGLLRAMEVVIFTAASALISISCLEFNGIASPLAMGVILVLVCRSAILSDHWRQGMLPVGLISLAHPTVLTVLALLFPGVARQFSEPRLVVTFVLNLLFIFGAAAITLAGGHAMWALRRKVFEARSLGRYRLKRCIGKGAMGEVWAAHHRTLNRDVAVKILRPEKKQDRLAMARFEREIQATAALTHPNTVRLFDYGVTDDGICYFAMELLDGRDLSDLMEREGPLPPERAAGLVQQVALALAEAHTRGIIHRDLKPANIFVTAAAGRTDLVKVLDFGLAKVSLPDDPALTHEGWAVGTPSYISPEVLQGDAADVSSDLYALGAILYYLVSGAPPFVSDDMQKVLHAHLHEEVVPLATRVEQEIPYGLERVVMRCLDKNPRRRFASAIELAGALEPFC